jgi:cytochrome c oxidase cbb3-type subunit 3
VTRTAFWSLFVLAAISGCKREARRFRDNSSGTTALSSVSMSPLQPGGELVESKFTTRYEDNAYAVSEGKRLFDQMNCSGCHSHGGGAIGPPLMDDDWIYGSDPQNIFATITEGRPNGMPAYRGHLPDSQIWELVAYVRALGGLQGKAIRTTRDDHMMYKESEQARSKGHPAQTFVPSKQ